MLFGGEFQPEDQVVRLGKAGPVSEAFRHQNVTGRDKYQRVK